MIKLFFFRKTANFGSEIRIFRIGRRGRYARPAPVSGPTDPKRQNRSPSSIFGHSRSLRGFRPPVRPFKNPDFSKTGSYLGNIEHSCVATNFDFDPGNFPAQERSTAPFVPRRISFPAGGRFVPAKHRLPGREAGSREGWKNRVQSLSLSRRRHLRRGPAGRRSVPGPKA